MSKGKRDRVRKLDQNIQERRGEGVKILDANSVFFFFFSSLVCLCERQRSEMEKCHLASIRLPLSSPCRSERWGEGLLKRVLKGCEPPFAFEIIPSLIFISTEHVKHVSTLGKKKKKKSEISLKLNFKISPAKGRPDCWVFGGWRDVKLQPRLPLKEGSKAEKEAAHFILAVFRHVAPPAFILNQCLDLAWIISWQWKTQIHCYVYVTVYHSCICL